MLFYQILVSLGSKLDRGSNCSDHSRLALAESQSFGVEAEMGVLYFAAVYTAGLFLYGFVQAGAFWQPK